MFSVRMNCVGVPPSFWQRAWLVKLFVQRLFLQVRRHNGLQSGDQLGLHELIIIWDVQADDAFPSECRREFFL